MGVIGLQNLGIGWRTRRQETDAKTQIVSESEVSKVKVCTSDGTGTRTRYQSSTGCFYWHRYFFVSFSDTKIR